jgi:hypothetical protein
VTESADEDVGRLDIAVNDARAVRGVQRGGDFDAERQQLFHFQTGMPGEALPQRGSLQILHGDEGAAILLADVVNGADVWMIQRGRGASLALEPAQRLAVVGQVVCQELENYGATEPRVLRSVDHTHSASAKLLDDAVVGERLADQGISALRHDGVLSGDRQRGQLDGRTLQKVFRVRFGVEQRSNPAFERLVTGAGVPQKRVALRHRALQYGLEQVIELFPVIQVHRRFHRTARDKARSWRCSSRVSP